MIIGNELGFAKREIEMLFSDENRFTRDIYTLTSNSNSKVIYRMNLADNRYLHFVSDLTPDKVFENIEQLVDDVQENIVGSKVDFHYWNDLVFHRDTTFDTTYFESPKPMYIYKCEREVGALGKLLLCLSKGGNSQNGIDGKLWYLTLRDTEGRVLDKDKADIGQLNDAHVAYRSLSLSAMPKAYFEQVKEQWIAHNDNVEDIQSLGTQLEDSVAYLQQEHDDNAQNIEDNASDIGVLEGKMNTVYSRTVGDDSLLSQTYRKALTNQLDIYDLDRQVNGYTSDETQQHVDGIVDDIAELQTDLATTMQNVDDNTDAIEDIQAYPEFNITGIPPFYLLRRGDFSSVSNRAYDPVLWEDLPNEGVPQVSQDLKWLHVAEKRIKEMPLRLMKDPDIKASALRICSEADGGTIGNRIEIGCYVGEFNFFADSPANWTTSSTYTRKEIMCLVSIVPAKYQGNNFKPALLFEILTGHLDGGSAAGDCTGAFCLWDKSETDVPDYHWYRYGETGNINGGLANIKVQYH